MMNDEIQDYSVKDGLSYSVLPFFVFFFAKSRMQISD